MTSTIYLRVHRVDADLCRRAAATSVSDLHEALHAMGHRTLMSSHMRPILVGTRIAGPAVTALCAPGDNLMMHRALSLTQAGDVLVVSCPSETSGAQWGDMAARQALRIGLAGVVVQGAIRDIDMLRELRFPAWSTHISPIHPDKRGHGLVNAPLVCDGVQVCPGDLIVADGDGVVVIPAAMAKAAVERAEARMAAEDRGAEAILSGQIVWDLSGAALSYAAMEVNERDRAWDDPEDQNVDGRALLIRTDRGV